MADKMLIDASHAEETRVVVVRGNRIEEVATLLFGRELERRSDLGESPPHLRDHARDLRCFLSHVFLDHLGREHREDLLEHLHER